MSLPHTLHFQPHQRPRVRLKSSFMSSGGPPLQEKADVRLMSAEPSALLGPNALLRTAHRLVTAGGRDGGASSFSSISAGAFSGGDAGIAVR